MNKPLVSFGVIVISAIFAYLVVYPAYVGMQVHRADIVGLGDTLAQAHTVTKLIEDTSTSLAGISDDEKKRFEAFIPEDFDEIRFANDLQHIGASRGIILDGIKVDAPVAEIRAVASARGFGGAVENTFSLDRPAPGSQTTVATSGTPDANNKKYRSIKTSFGFTAPYSTFLLFLDSLEKSLGLINVTSLALSPAPPEQGAPRNAPPQYRFTVDIETYTLKK